MKITLETKESVTPLIDKGSSDLGITRNKYINVTLETFADLPKELKGEISRAILVKKDKLVKDLGKYTSGYQTAKIEYEIERCKRILDFVNDYTVSEQEDNMRIVNIEDGYVKFPNDWLTINIEKASESKFVYVVEVGNYNEYDIPHLIGFSDKPINKLTDIDISKIYDECEKICPNFEKTRLYAEKGEKIAQELGDKLTMDIWSKYPIIGVFPISDYDNPYGMFTYGAMIIRGEKNGK